MSEQPRIPEDQQQHFLLYRGDFGLDSPILKSKIKLSEFSGNPHSHEYKNQLLWLTPIKNYAERVAIARAIASCLSNPNDVEPFSRASLTKYEVARSTQVYSSDQEYLMPVSSNNEMPSQVIIQGADAKDVNLQTLDEDSKNLLANLLNSPIPKEKLGNFLGRVNMRLMSNIYPPEENAQLPMKEYLKKFIDQILTSMGAYIESVHKVDARNYVLDIVAESVFIYLLKDVELEWK